MVQLAGYKGRSSAKGWWKLHSGEQHGTKQLLQILEDGKYPFKSKSKGLPRLRALFVRCQRGLMSYEGTPLSELKLYVTQRALPVIPGQKVTVTGLKAQLEQADEDFTFPFSELFPELRNMVFSYYFNSFDDPPRYLVPRCQPPITHVSRTVRRESLPIFYGRFNFRIISAACSLAHKPMWYHLHTEELLQRTTPKHLSWLRTITLDLRLVSCQLILEIDVCNRSTPVKITRCGRKDTDLPHPTQEILSHLLSELESFIRNIAAREGDCKLQMSDLTQLQEKARSMIDQPNNPV
jgi:hypothetical protein